MEGHESRVAHGTANDLTWESGGVEHSQGSKFCWPHSQDGHECKTDDKHRQGCKVETSKNEQAIPPADCD